MAKIETRYRQRRVLLLSLVLLVFFFILTAGIAGAYHAEQMGLARGWLRAGDQDLKAGHVDQAVVAFRNALNYDPEDSLTQRQLAEALLKDGRLSEAKAYFMNLWDRTPGSGEINAGLARIYVRSDSPDDAVRYYHNAINGVWDGNSEEQRRMVRIELAEFLLSRGEQTAARPEIAAIAAETPSGDADSEAEAGKLFLQAGSPDQALPEFEKALRSNPDQAEWLEDAGRTAFDLGNYPTAKEYLTRAADREARPDVTALLQTVSDVFSFDPYRPGLSDSEQAVRTRLDFDQASKRLQECLMQKNPGGTPPASDPLETLAQEAKLMRGRATSRSLQQEPELRKQIMRLVFQMEKGASSVCGAPQGPDNALELIAKEHADETYE